MGKPASAGRNRSSKQRATERDCRSLPNELPGRPIVPVEPFFISRVPCESEFRWVPFEGLMMIVREVHQVTNDHRVRADVHITNRPLAIADASKPVGFMIVALIQANGAVFKWFFTQCGWSGFEFAPVHVNPALGSFKSDSVAVVVNDFHSIGVAEARAVCWLFTLGSEDFDGTTFIHAEAPLSDVEMVRSPIGDHAAAVLTVIAPVWKV